MSAQELRTAYAALGSVLAAGVLLGFIMGWLTAESRQRPSLSAVLTAPASIKEVSL